jgi:zinc transport system ATP-binding protein
MSVIIVENLFFAYSMDDVLTDISFKIEAGEFVGLFGPNGGGKSTLLALLMGFLKPKKGSIRIFEQSPIQARSQMAWVPQTFHFDRHFPISVEEVVLGGRLSKLSWMGRFGKSDSAAVSASLERVGMENYKEAPFSILSGGQAQRVLIARALASNPSLLLLDEPTASVDYAAQAEIYRLLTSLKKEITVVMVTHDLHAAVKHVDKVFCVQKNLIPMAPEKVCEHFAMGLYHAPLKIGKELS